MIVCKFYLTLFFFSIPLLFAGENVKKQAKLEWPSESEWQGLQKRIQGKVIGVSSPKLIYQPHKWSKNKNLSPFFLEQQPGATQSSGWLNAWKSAISPHAVAVENTNDVVQTILFAKKHRLKLVIKGTGHDYLGRSNAQNSLLLWTHNMREVSLLKCFSPQGAPPGNPKVEAVSIQAGARWLEVYQLITSKHGRYVQGGGCTSVGAAGGFLQGGGFGSFSKKYGIAAANLLEAEIVTADGKILIANEYQNEDLFWALKGGGGGTFGIVTQVILKTHKLSKMFGVLKGKIRTHSSKTFENLIRSFINFYYAKLNNEHWGEQIRINHENSLDIFLVFQDLSKEEAEAIWKPFLDSIRKNGYFSDVSFFTMPAKKMWDYYYLKNHFPDLILYDKGEKGEFWWAGDSRQISMYWYTYQSRWIPIKLFEKSQSKKLAKMLFQAARKQKGAIELHFNKGLAGASQEAIKNGKKTCINPVVFDSAALLIMSSGMPHFIPGVSKLNLEEAESKVAGINDAMNLIYNFIPQSGSYLNESDYFLKNWQEEYWGINYPKLLKIKHKYDPENFFSCHHSVGSEEVTEESK